MVQWGKLAGVVFGIVEMAIFTYAITNINAMRGDWNNVMKSGKVLTVQMPEFWGPVHAILPSDCSMMTKMDKAVEQNEKNNDKDDESPGSKDNQAEKSGEGKDDKSPASQDKQAEKSEDGKEGSKKGKADKADNGEDNKRPGSQDNQAENSKGKADKADNGEESTKAIGTDNRKPAGATRKLRKQSTETHTGMELADEKVNIIGEGKDVELEGLMEKFKVNKCDEEIELDPITGSQSFWSVRWFSKMFTGQHDTMAELHASREWMFFVTCAFAFLGMIVNFGDNIYALVAGPPAGFDALPGVQLTQEQQATKQLDDMKKSHCAVAFAIAGLQTALKKWGTFYGQLTICSLFLTFWDEDHFVMIYIPGAAYAILFTSQLALYVILIVSRVYGPTSPQAKACYSGYQCLSCLFCPVCFCFIGYSFYQLQFLLATSIGNVLAEKAVFMAKFVAVSDIAIWKVFATCACSEVAAVALLEGLAAAL